MIYYKSFIVLVILTLFAFYVRFADINKPLYDAHAWRQTDTYAIAENFYQEGFNILKPKTNEIKPITNKERIFLAELPLYEYTLAIFFNFFWNSISVARLFSIGLISLTTLLIYYLGKKIFSFCTGLSSAIIFNLFPGSIFWGSAILSDVLALLLSTLAFALFISNKKKLFFFSFLSLGFAISIKPFYLILLILLYGSRALFWF